LQAPADCKYLIDKPDGLVQAMFFSGGSLYVLPFYLNGAFAIDAGSGGVSGLPAFQAECEIGAPPVLFDKYSAAWQYGTTLYALGCRSRTLTVYDTMSDTAQTVAIAAGANRIPTHDLRKDAKYCDAPEDFLYAESGAVDTEAFVAIATNYVDTEFLKKQSEVSKKANRIHAQSAGSSIYEDCKDLVWGAPIDLRKRG
jgi:hypothetical protein